MPSPNLEDVIIPDVEDIYGPVTNFEDLSELDLSLMFEEIYGDDTVRDSEREDVE